MNEWVIFLVGGAACLVSVLAAFLKYREMQKDVRKHVSIQVDDETFEVEARSADIQTAIKRLREDSLGQVIRHAAR
jgi:hypothetical protein